MSDSGEQNYGERVRSGDAGGGCVVPASCISFQARRPRTGRLGRFRLRSLRPGGMGVRGLKALVDSVFIREGGRRRV
ncbi:hypothetical protein J1605_015864 [Eschrichtius robustus]|uniref:Uncharacterized protein n=1 Tax=Eschrichtius robustus TaxID=9764 RepID=A0AB34GB03_ESCRO|nr:hypothetical protein J1605_015864 [Eschrichtius robustus]